MAVPSAAGKTCLTQQHIVLMLGCLDCRSFKKRLAFPAGVKPVFVGHRIADHLYQQQLPVSLILPPT